MCQQATTTRLSASQVTLLYVLCRVNAIFSQTIQRVYTLSCCFHVYNEL